MPELRGLQAKERMGFQWSEMFFVFFSYAAFFALPGHFLDPSQGLLQTFYANPRLEEAFGWKLAVFCGMFLPMFVVWSRVYAACVF